MENVKRSISLSAGALKMVDYLSETENITINKYIVNAINEKIQKDMILRSGGFSINACNVQQVGRVTKETNINQSKNKIDEMIKELEKITDICNEVDPLFSGFIIQELYDYMCQRLIADDIKDIKKYIDIRNEDIKMLNRCF